ncbi:MAG: phosphotransferase [Alphaproteobacteria bacterium]|nr:phosphotransferase [Alphaproteobacteria bacterium]
MGVILRVLSGCEDLTKANFRHMFLDMEENIHIHYRDLRIELSRNEFEEIVNTFSKQSAELMAIINSSNYKDGVLPNANHEEKRIWTESRLETEVTYHPHRVSLEKCTDGYHVHLRNYKLLFSEEDFRVIVKAFREVNLDAPYASSLVEVLKLFDANHLHYKITGSNRILVAHYHDPKVRAILQGIGCQREISGEFDVYIKGDFRLETKKSWDRADFSDKFEGAPKKLAFLCDYLTEHKDSVNPDWLNAIKARVLDTFSYFNATTPPPPINLDHNTWIYDERLDLVIFPFDASSQAVDSKATYSEWTKFLTSYNLHFVKPTKIAYPAQKQKALYEEILEELNKQAEQVQSISKIYLMGSTIKGNLGYYKAPFILSDWSKLGSDIDILIEIDDQNGFTPNKGWKYINLAHNNQCFIYHLGQLAMTDQMQNRKRFPNISHFEHLLDAYVFLPSRCDVKMKDDFLKKHNAQLVFDRSPYGAIREALEHEFAETIGNITRLNVNTDNEIYDTVVGDKPAILKVYKVSGNFASSRLAEHTVYEGDVIQAVRKFGGNIPALLPTKTDQATFQIGGAPAGLFEKLDGQLLTGTNYPITESAHSLAQFHQLQIDNPITINTGFFFDENFDIWHTTFSKYADESKDDEELTAKFAGLQPIHGKMNEIYSRLKQRMNLYWVHNHGDVQPRNVFMKDGTAYFFDLQNAFYGPRLFDLVDGAIEFCYDLKDPDGNDFHRFDQFIAAYKSVSALTDDEAAALPDAINVVGIIKFIKEVRMIRGDKNKNNIRRRRALDLANHLLGLSGKRAENSEKV